MLGYTPQVFWDITPRELQNAINGYRKKEDEAWERLRWGIYYNLQPYSKNGFSINKIKLPIDKERLDNFHSDGKVIRMTKEEVREEWRKSGIELSEKHLDRMCKNEK